MRTFHSGGVAGGDITQGLPRVEEIFEARRPKKSALLSDFDGTVKIEEVKRTKQIIVKDDYTGEERANSVPYVTKIIVEDGEKVKKCQKLTEGTETPGDILRISGLDAVYSYIIKEIQKVYRIQGVEIADKHIEIIARQMTRKIRVENPGSTELLMGSAVDITEFDTENEKIRAINAANPESTPLMEAEGTSLLLGITKASLSTDSFLSAASFQETTKVLTEAAVKGKVDPLLGLKENVIIGKLIPAGTGMKMYRDVEIDMGDNKGGVYDAE
jgi:DNA-directed RNA polymerase subunit beta'